MKYIKTIFIFLISAIVSGQCKKDTSVQYYDSTYQSYSETYNVTVEFGTGSEISNNYNYSNYESDDLYCLIYGFDKKYEVKLFSNYSSIYKTSCSSISNIFTNGFIKGKDQDGRIWKIRKPSSQDYSNNENNYNRNNGYNKPKSRINHKYIASTLKSMQAKIDHNREVLSKLIDDFNRRRDLIHYKIEKLNTPKELKKMFQTINSNVENCARNIDTGSNRATSLVVSCMNRQFTQLDILEYEINNYSVSETNKSHKSFTIESVTKKDVNSCKITKIFNKDNKTIVEFDYVSQYQKDGWINIKPETYIYDLTNNKKLKLIGTWNTVISPKKKSVPYNKVTTYQLTFEKLDNNSRAIDIIEDKDNYSFNFYGVIIY